MEVPYRNGWVYLIWICAYSDWLIPAQDLGDFSNLKLSVLPACSAFREIAL